MKNGLIILIICSVISNLFAEGNKIKGENNSFKSGTNFSTVKFNINNVSTYFSNNGASDLDPDGNAGFVFPKGSSKAVFYESGLVWGAKVDESIRVGGSTYNHGLQGGRILNSDLSVDQLIADDSTANLTRIFRVRRDFAISDLSSEAQDENKTVSEVYSLYEKDWNEWPASAGAPFEDINSDGVYDPAVDIPGIPGADQTIWFVSNDLNETSVLGLYGSHSIGIEVQTTVWGYDQDGPLGNMLFRKYVLINKSDKNFDDMYVAMWSDPDVGSATDDFVGCDTTLSLGYCYNGITLDGVYGSKVPACGFDFVQGPVISGNPNDTAIFKNKKITGYKNLQMTAFFYFLAAVQGYIDPPLGTYEGSKRFYNFLQGKSGITGEYFPVPEELGGGVTKTPLSGDPVTGTGYVDGILFPAGDRRYGMSSGPFSISVGDTQEVVIAQIAAVANSNLSSVTLLKYYDENAQEFYNTNFGLQQHISDVENSENLVDNFDLSQNYPNPFNPATTISYSLKEKSNVRLEVFDILGRKVSTIVNEEKPAGIYKANFNASFLASGVYFYRLKAGNFVEVKKMMMLK